MVGFCGALDFEGRSAKFSVLKKMCGLHSAGCAFIKDEFGILCDNYAQCKPLTVSYNNFLYTAAVVAPSEPETCAQSILQGYFEQGEDFFRTLDFPFAMALYDSRVGELTLAKGAAGDMPLFYTVRDGIVYFASALRPLIRLYGGCVRINADVLAAHIRAPYKCIPDGLFCDIHPIRGAVALVCSSFGQSIVPLKLAQTVKKSKQLPFFEPDGKGEDVRHALTEALFAFDYPQFDCFMPALCEQLARCKLNGERIVSLYDGIPEDYSEYSAERAERLGRVWGIDVQTGCGEKFPMSKKGLKKMEREIDKILEEYTQSKVIVELCRKISIDEINEQKSIPMRIRQKGMLCQSAMWFESFNLVT